MEKTMLRENLEKLKSNHERRLQKLKEKQALQGQNTPAELLIEIEDIEAAIKELQIELNKLESTSPNLNRSGGGQKKFEDAPINNDLKKQKIAQLLASRKSLKYYQSELEAGNIDLARYSRRLATVWEEQLEILFNLLEMAQVDDEEKLVELLSMAISEDNEATWSQLLPTLLAWQRRN